MRHVLGTLALVVSLTAFADTPKEKPAKKPALELKNTFWFDTQDLGKTKCTKFAPAMAKTIKKMTCQKEKGVLSGDKPAVGSCTTKQVEKKPVPYCLFFTTNKDCEAELAAEIKNVDKN
ncbi:MAG TPA: hypothetical protein VGM90_16720 [Kofleriaceae bacterium]|jgi:hypothetical protein